MTHRSTAGLGSCKRIVLAVVASAFLTVGAPVVANSAAAGAHKQVSGSFGDCKNPNAGKHNGYDCPVVTPSVDDGSGSSADAADIIGIS